MHWQVVPFVAVLGGLFLFGGLFFLLQRTLRNKRLARENGEQRLALQRANVMVLNSAKAACCTTEGLLAPTVTPEHVVGKRLTSQRLSSFMAAAASAARIPKRQQPMRHRRALERDEAQAASKGKKKRSKHKRESVLELYPMYDYGRKARE